MKGDLHSSLFAPPFFKKGDFENLLVRGVFYVGTIILKHTPERYSDFEKFYDKMNVPSKYGSYLFDPEKGLLGILLQGVLKFNTQFIPRFMRGKVPKSKEVNCFDLCNMSQRSQFSVAQNANGVENQCS